MTDTEERPETTIAIPDAGPLPPSPYARKIEIEQILFETVGDENGLYNLVCYVDWRSVRMRKSFPLSPKEPMRLLIEAEFATGPDGLHIKATPIQQPAQGQPE